MGSSKPPRAAAALLRFLTLGENRESVLGDFEEIYDDLALRCGPLAARTWLARQILRSIPLLFANILAWRIYMFQLDFKLALRNLLKSKGFSLLNIAGLALGMAMGFLILLFVRQETSFDRFHEKHDRIVRISTRLSIEGRQMNLITVPGPLGLKLKEELPAVLNAARMRNAAAERLSFEDSQIEAVSLLNADPGFFDLFSVRIFQGDPDGMLDAPFSLVLTDETARRLFGREDPVGRMVKLNDNQDYAVTGVVRAMPATSHIRFDALISLATLQKTRGDVDSWLGFNYITYLELRPGVSPDSILPQIQDTLDRNLPAEIKAMNVQSDLSLMPIERIHLHSHSENEISVPGNPSLIRILTLIGVFILFLAGINFVNLSTARSGKRAKEVGVRKVLGAERHRLVVQFLGESIILSVVSLVIAVGLILLILPLFNRLIAQSLEFQPFRSGFVLPGLLGMAVLVGLLAGFYPALVLARHRPHDALRPSARSKSGRRGFRNGLVTFQYVVSIALICSTLIIRNQIRYVKNFDLGFKKDQLVELPLRYQLSQKSDIYKTEVSRLPGVESIALCTSAPGRVNSETIFRFEGTAAQDRLVLPVVDTDGGYIRTIGLPLAAGRDFSPDLETDRSSMIINEKLARDLGWDDPLGKSVKMMGVDESTQFIETPFTVIGVVKDHHFESLRTPIRGQVILSQNRDIGSLLVRLRTDRISETMKAIGDIARKIEPSRPFRYSFISESFDRMYRSEERLGQVLFLFAGLALFVAGLGLFGLAAYTAERRTKEIGIRKALGASSSQIVFLLTREFLRWVALACLLAWPIAYLGMKSWMAGFAYRAGFNPFIFIASAGLAMGMAVAAMGLKTAGAASADPVRALRYE